MSNHAIEPEPFDVGDFVLGVLVGLIAAGMFVGAYLIFNS
jgi:hypothetical protein